MRRLLMILGAFLALVWLGGLAVILAVIWTAP